MAGEGVEHGHEHGGAVDHGRVDHLTLARRPRLEQGAGHAEGQEHAAAAEVAHQVERRHGLVAGPPDGVERAGQGDVVDVVAGGLGVGTALAPARHAAEHEAGVAGQAHVGTEAEALGHAGPEALDEGVGRLDQAEQGLDAVGVLEVDADRAPAPVQHVGRRVGRIAAHDRLGPVDADHVGPHVGQHHGRERAGPDAGDLQDLDALQRPHQAAAAERAASAVMASTTDGAVEGGQVVTHALEDHELGAGDDLGRALAARHGDQRVDVAVDDERVDVELAQGVGAAARGQDGQELVTHALGVEAAVERRRRPCAAARSSSKCSGLEISAAALDLAGDVALAVVRGGRSSSTGITSGLGWPTSGSPVVDMIDVSDSTRSGCSMAIVCTIMPPIDAPTMWARSMPRASSRPIPSAAMSVSR